MAGEAISKKKRIAFCSELGSGSGHLTALLAAADVFVEQGSECAFIVPDLNAVLRLRPDWSLRSNVQAWNSPQWQVKNPEQANSTRTYTFADVLISFGFGDALSVFNNISRWHALLDAFRPDVLVTEFAPGPAIAARGRIPCVTFGNGFYVLPNVAKLPSMTSWDPEVPEESRRNESLILAEICEARRRLDLSSWDSLSEAFRGDATLPCTFATLDPYHRIRSELTHLPFNIPFPRRSKPSERSGRGFVYYSFPHPVFERVLSLALAQCKTPCWIYAPSYESQLRPYVGVNGHKILSEPMDLHRLSEFSFCMHHGGMGISSAGAIANVPQFITPVNLEHALTASSLCSQAAAIMALPETIMAWQSSSSWGQAVAACLALPMNLHPEFNCNSSDATLTLSRLTQQVLNFLQ